MKGKRTLSFFDRLFLWINYACCAALLISYLAPIADPRQFWPIAFFGLAYPVLLIVNAILIVFWLLRKKWLFLLSSVCIFLGWGVLNNNIGFNGNHGKLNPTGKTIRMMTYNVHNFKKFGSNKDVSTKHEILDLIARQHPDIIGFQEFYTRKKGEYDMVDSIKKIMRSANYYFEPFDSNADEAIGMAIFSKYAIVNKGLIRLSSEVNSGNQSLYIDVKKDSSIFRVYSVHLQSIRFEQEDYDYLDTVTKSGVGDIKSTMRLAYKLKKAFLKRAEQVFMIKTNAAKCPYPYLIAGDFNDTPTSFAVNQMARGLKNTFREKGSGLGRTYNGNFPNYQIDYIMAVPRFSVTSYQIIEKKLSDHYPVVSDLILR